MSLGIAPSPWIKRTKPILPAAFLGSVKIPFGLPAVQLEYQQKKQPKICRLLLRYK